MMGRRATIPLPPNLWRPFLEFAWQTAAAGRTMTIRRHGLAALWLSGLGLRFSELRRLEFDDLSVASLQVFVTRSKSGHSDYSGVTARLVELTLEWRRQLALPAGCGLLLPTAAGTPLDNNAFNRDAVGYFKSDPRFRSLRLSAHSFRDTAAQIAMWQCGSVADVQRVLGHRSARTTEHYLSKHRSAALTLRIDQLEQFRGRERGVA